MLGLKVQDNADFAAEIIRQVREHETLSRVELARVLNVAASTIGRHVDALVAQNYFKESLEPTREAGRPPTRLRPNPQRGCFIGVDFHGSVLHVTAVDFAQNALFRSQRSVSFGNGADSVMAEIASAIRDASVQARLPVLAVGVAAPGQVDTKRGIGVRYGMIPGWADMPVVEKLREAGFPAFLENNIRSMALAERWFGQGRGCRDLICLGVRIGVNAGVVRDGQLATGHRELGGEIRGWNCPVYNSERDKWEWNSGANVEKHASLPAAAARYQQLSGKKAGVTEFLEAARGQDRHALMALREVASIHGWVISQMVQLVDPEIVILAGPLTSLGDIYLDAVTKAAVQFESEHHKSTPILVSELGEYAGAMGAAALALERWRPEDISERTVTPVATASSRR